MSAKRPRDVSEDDHDYGKTDKSEQKKLRTLPSFATVIREAVRLKSLDNLFAAIEPLLRRVVQEEVEGVLLHSTVLLQRSPPVDIEEVEPTSLSLVFKNPPSLPIFTGTKIEDSDNNPLQIILIDTHSGSAAKLSHPIKLQLVVIDGDFPSCEGHQQWSSAQFEKKIVKERAGKRPLLLQIGDAPVILRDGVAAINGELSFTDNSSWIRSQHFRIGVRVVVPDGYSGPRIREAVTVAFRVKDHRGELYKKHFPPALTDEIWRLKNIGRDGAFYSRLSSNGIYTVHDFLKLWAVNPLQLRNILGGTDRVWEATVEHARTCPVGERVYALHRNQFTIFVNNICELTSVAINGVTISLQQLTKAQKEYVQEMVHEAYQNFGNLQERDGQLYNTVEVQNVQPTTQVAIEAPSWYPSSEIQIDDFEEVETPTSTMHWNHHFQYDFPHQSVI